MFEGTPLPAPPWELLLPALAMVALAALSLAALRVVQAGEWTLTWSSILNPRIMWYGRHVEGGRTAGVGTSHLVGLCGWGIIGWACGLGESSEIMMEALPFKWPQLVDGPTGSAWNGVALGFASIPMRWAARNLAGWMAEVDEVGWQHGETDRLLRNVLTALLALEIIGLTVQSRATANAMIGQHWVLFTYVAFLAWRSFRMLQLFRISNLSIAWGFAYLCTLELIPSWVLISVLLGG